MLNRALKVLLVTNGLILLATAMLGPIYALFVEDIGGDLLDASYAGAAYAIAAGITTYFAGKYSDKLKEGELVMVAGYIVVGIGFLLYIAVDSIWSLLVVQLLIGFGEAVYSSPYDAVYTKHMTVERAGQQWGVWEVMNYFVAAVGAIAGGIIAAHFGFNTLFVAMGVLTLSSAVYIYFLPREVL